MAGTENAWLRAVRTDRVWQLMLANLLVFLAMHALAFAGVGEHVLVRVFTLPANPLAFITAPWTLVLYMFAQWDFFHLVFNMLWLWTFGLVMTRLGVSGLRMLMAYLAGGLTAGVVWVALGALGLAHGVLLGSSAAVMGVIACGGVLLGSTRVQLMFFGNVQVRWMAVVVIVLCLLADGAQQSWATVVTHACGALAGALYAFVLKGRRPKIRATSPKGSYTPIRRPARRGLDATEQARLDDLLLKVKSHGYAALSPAEKKTLFQLSSKIK